MYTEDKDSHINPELLAYWFFHLNVCLTFVNFIIHPDSATYK